MPPTCSARLKHAHGDSECELPIAHAGKHKGVCYACFDSELNDPNLQWVLYYEDWTWKPSDNDV